MANKRLFRSWYPTDVSDDDPEYVGTFSERFPAPRPGMEIVDVDWSVRGEVQVTWLVGD